MRLTTQDKMGQKNRSLVIAVVLVFMLAMMPLLNVLPYAYAEAEPTADEQVQLDGEESAANEQEQIANEGPSPVEEEVESTADALRPSSDGLTPAAKKPEEQKLSGKSEVKETQGVSESIKPLAGDHLGFFISNGSEFGGFTPVRYALYDAETPGGDLTATVVGFEDASVGTPTGRLAIPESVIHNGETYVVTEIAENAFKDTKRLASLTLPDSLVKIGPSAFEGCWVKDIVFGSAGNLKEIGNKAFYHCSVTQKEASPNQLIIPEGVETIGASAFASPNTWANQGGPADMYVLTLPSTLVFIGDNAFSRALWLSGDLNIPGNVKHIGKEAFFDNEKVTSLTLNEGTEYIGEAAFSCFGNDEVDMGVVTIPNSVTYMGDEVFLLSSGIKGFERQKLAGIEVEFPALPGNKVFLDQDYEGVVTSNNGEIALGKSAKWTNDDLTEAEISIDYGERLVKGAALDIVFVLDYSGSMTWSADIESQGTTYNYPRLFLMEDIMHDTIDELLGATSKGYDIRIGMTAFSSAADEWHPIGSTWSTGGFSTNAADLKNNFANNPHAFGGTQYELGLASAIEMFENRAPADQERQPVIIFMSDGIPNYGSEGLDLAQDLRDKGISLFPMGIYIDSLAQDGFSSPEEAEAALKAISYDGETAFISNTTGEFEEIMGKVIIRSVTTMNTFLEDVISEFFVAEDITDIEVDGGLVSLEGQKVTWDLGGLEKGRSYNMTITVKLEEEFWAQKDDAVFLPTNESLKTLTPEGELLKEATEQPELYRGVVRYEFVSGTTNMALPDAINGFLPQDISGYNEGAKVTPKNPSDDTYIDTANDGIWAFVEWDKEEVTVGSADVTFVGQWFFTSNTSGNPDDTDDPKDPVTPNPPGTPDSIDPTPTTSDPTPNSTPVNADASNQSKGIVKTGDNALLFLIVGIVMTGALGVSAAGLRMKRTKK